MSYVQNLLSKKKKETYDIQHVADLSSLFYFLQFIKLTQYNYLRYVCFRAKTYT